MIGHQLRRCSLGLLGFVGIFAGAALAHEGHDHDHEDGRSGAAIITTRETGRVLPLRDETDVFHFVIYGDRTGGVPAGLRVLEQAVEDTNLLDPDLVLTVGDLIQGYNAKPEWLEQAREYKAIMNRLKMPWYPVAGNHDIYWRGEGAAPAGHHEANYEEHFGPLWYAFQHKNAGFIILFSDEGDGDTNEKGFGEGRLQTMSPAQLAFLDKALKELKDADHVFAFLHHPRWLGGGYRGGNWDVVHDKLKSAGNVTAVFAGHIHHMHYGGVKDGIAYYTLATTGGHLSADMPDAGYLHHMNLVTVRPDRISVAALPVGAVIDPKTFTSEFLAEVSQAASIRPRTESPAVLLQVDGSARGVLRYSLSNPCPKPVDCTICLDEASAATWNSTLDHQHFQIPPGDAAEIEFELVRQPKDVQNTTIPALRLQMEYLSESSRVRIPTVEHPITIAPAAVPSDYFQGVTNRCLQVNGSSAALRIDHADIPLPDGPMTLECWARPDKLDGVRGIVAKTQQCEYALFLDEGVPLFDIHLNGRYVTASAGTNKLPVDEWTHLAGVFDGERVMLFVNGKLAESQTASGKRTQTALPLFIGADPDSRGRPTRAFSGQIDELRLSKIARYDSSFSPAQRFSPDEASILLLHLDRNVGPFVLDHSPVASKAVFGSNSRLVEVADRP
jgi:hypothetical protein